MANATATNEKNGKTVTLNVIDPDSNAVVPASKSPFALFAGDFMLESQNNQELIFVNHPGTASQKLTLLPISDQVDDVRWATSSSGTLYVSDTAANTVYAITGHFTLGTAFAAGGTFVGTLDLTNGKVSPVVIGLAGPAGMWFVS